MAPRTYKVKELLALRGHSEISFERHFIDSMTDRGECADILRVKHLVALPPSNVDRDSTDQGISESIEPIRQQLYGHETDVKQDEAAANEQRRLPQTTASELGPNLASGFGQFIKAVTSPSNVRVTAGGRIVANTRGASPTAKLYREKAPGDALILSRPGSQSGHIVPATVAGTYMQPPPIYSPFGTFHGALYQPSMQLPMATMSVGSGAFAPQPGSFFAAPSQSKSTGEDDTKATEQNPAVGTGTPQAGHPGPQGHNYHGGFFPPMMAMPMPMQMPMPVPIGMMHPQMHFQNHAAPAFGYAHGHHPATYGQAAGSVPLSVSQYGHYHAVPGIMPAAAPTHLSAYQYTAYGNAQSMNVPASSIKLSDVIKKHLEGFREHLKWTNDQLEYNTHQIDVKDMKVRIIHIREQIATHERRLQEQLEAEKKLEEDGKAIRSARQSDTVSASTMKQVKVDAAAVTIGVAREAKSEVAKNQDFKIHQDDNIQYPAYKKDRSRPKSWNMKQKSMHLMASTDNERSSDASSAPLHLQSHNIVTEPVKKPSGLPMTAALAPPFEPRSHQDQPSQEDFSDPTARPLDSVAGRSPPQSSSSYGGALGHTRGIRMTKEATTGLAATNDLGKPYLQGKLRFGIDPLNARDDDYSYPRKLTEEELRARHFYWAKAPRTVTQGLPKYDGKDFYPASPIKEATPASPVKENVPRTDAGFFGRKPAMPTSSYTDYIFKATSSVDMTSVDGTAKKPAVDRQNQYLALLEQHYQKVEMADKKAHGKRSTKSDNINGSAVEVKKKSFSRDRPTASLISQDTTNSADPAKTAQRIATSDALKAESNQSIESDSSCELLFKGRRAMQRSGNRSGLWQSFGKRTNAGSANALPGAMSSTNAHGVLPQYAGSAAASLSPAMSTSGGGALLATSSSPASSPVKV